MINSNFIDKLCHNIPKHQKDKFIKYAFIIGLDKLIKKGFMKRLDLQKVKQYKNKIYQKGRIDPTTYVDDESSIKNEIQNLKIEINNLAKNLEKKPQKADQIEISYSSTTKNKMSNQNQNQHPTKQSAQNKKDDMRKRSSSFDKKNFKHDNQLMNILRVNEVTPKITETVPQQLFQNFNINISKHHLDDSEIKEVFQNQCLLQMNSANKKKLSRQQKTKSQVSRTFNNPYSQQSISQKPPISRNSIDNHNNDQNYSKNMIKENVTNSQKFKERYEQELKQQINDKIKKDEIKYQVQAPLQKQDTNKQENLRQNNQKRCHYDPNAHVNLPYNQNQAQSKIKEYVDEARRNYKRKQDQYTPQEQSDFNESQSNQNESVLNTANFTNKTTNIEFVKPKYYDQPQKIEQQLYKSTVTSVLNEDINQDIYHQESQSQEQDSNGYVYSNNRSQQKNNLTQLNPQVHSNSFSQQFTKRSQASKEDMTFINSPQQVTLDEQIKNKERGSKSVQAIQQFMPQFNSNGQNQKPQQQQRLTTKENNKPKGTQQSYGLSSQKMSLELSAQKQSQLQSQYWDKASNKNNLYPKMVDNDDYNKSSGSSNFSVFNPNDDLKTFFQNDFLEKKKYNMNNSIRQDSRPSMSSSHQSESQRGEKISNNEHYENDRWFIKKAPDNANISQDEIVKSNVFQNNRLSVTRILHNSQF